VPSIGLLFFLGVFLYFSLALFGLLHLCVCLDLDVVMQEYFVDMFPLYLTSHFQPAFELLVALLMYLSFARTGYFLETFSVYLLVIGLLWTPLIFNPNGLDFTYARFAPRPCVGAAAATVVATAAAAVVAVGCPLLLYWPEMASVISQDTTHTTSKRLFLRCPVASMYP